MPSTRCLPPPNAFCCQSTYMGVLCTAPSMGLSREGAYFVLWPLLFPPLVVIARYLRFLDFGTMGRYPSPLGIPLHEGLISGAV